VGAIVTVHERPRRRGDVQDVVIDDERVVWDPVGGRVHRLNPMGSLIWELLDGSATLDELAGDVADVFRVDRAGAARDLADLVGQLDDAGLLESATTSARADGVRTLANPPSP